MGRWFWEIDRVLLLLIAVLIAIGLVAVAAASPAAAQRYSGGDVHFAPLYYFWRQLLWIAHRLPVMIAVSMMPKRARAAAGAGRRGVLLRPADPGADHRAEVNGARRWIGFGFGQVQPSEFLKPFFIVSARLAAVASRTSDKSLPVCPISAVLTGAIAVLLMKQPDFGQTIIFCAVWMALLALAGVSRAHPRHPRRGAASSASSSPISSIRSRRRASTSSCSAPATISRSTMRCAR